MLKQGGGAIINVASTAGLRSPAMEAIYAAAKAGLIAFSRACFNELREGGVRVSVVIPGLVDTGFIPSNKHLDRALMLQPADIARAIHQILTAPPETCPVEMVLEPARNPERAALRLHPCSPCLKSSPPIRGRPAPFFWRRERVLSAAAPSLGRQASKF